MKDCPCGSGALYADCCRPYHQGTLPETALKLMRSRFSAYALGLSRYIIETTHPLSPLYEEDEKEWGQSIQEFTDSTRFDKLEILDFKEKGDVATVAFVAYLTQGKANRTFTEKSFFEKIRGKWFYRKGHLEGGKAPHLIHEGELEILPLAYYGDPVLRKEAAAIPEITEEVKELARRMIATMEAEAGMGIAAPQVHHSLRLFVIRTPLENEKGEVTLGPVKVMINPILSEVEGSWVAPEGCLSIPGLRGDVERPLSITVEYLDLEGNEVKEQAQGWHAKVILHENDHINGVLYTDHLSQAEKQAIAPHLEKMEARVKKLRGG